MQWGVQTRMILAPEMKVLCWWGNSLWFSSPLAFTSSIVQMLIWTLLQRWEKPWWADLQSWQTNLSTQRSHLKTFPRTQASTTIVKLNGPTWSNYPTSGQLILSYWTKSRFECRTNCTKAHTFLFQAVWAYLPRIISQPGSIHTLFTQNATKQNAKMRTRFSGKRLILCSSLAVASAEELLTISQCFSHLKEIVAS